MKDFLKRLWKDVEGTEVVEWVIVGAILTAVAAAGYEGVLGTQIETTIGGIAGYIGGLTP